MAGYGSPTYNAMLAEAQRQQNLMNQMNITQGKLYLMELAERQDAAKRQSQQATLAGAMGGGTTRSGTTLYDQHVHDYYNQGGAGGGSTTGRRGFVFNNVMGHPGPGMVVNKRGVVSGGYARPAGTVDENGNVRPLVGFYSDYPVILNSYSSAPGELAAYVSGLRDWLDHLQFAPIPQFAPPRGGAGGGAGGGSRGNGGQPGAKQPVTDPLLHDGRNRAPDTKRKYPLIGEPSWSKPYDSPQLPNKSGATPSPPAEKTPAQNSVPTLLNPWEYYDPNYATRHETARRKSAEDPTAKGQGR